MFPSVFVQVAAVLLIAVVLAAVGSGLRQPLIIGFVICGILVGPSGLGWIASGEEIGLLADMGIALLLFVVGLKLDLHTIRTMGWVALAVGLGQVLFTSVVGFLIALGFGLGTVEALYMAMAVTFSSTVIVVKLLTDRRELDALHGRIAVGLLIVQDIVVVVVMVVLSAFGATGTGGGSLFASLGAVAGKGAAFALGLALLTRYALPGLLRWLARSSELLVLFAITWAVVLAAGAESLGFSMEVGALLAGVSLAFTPFREAIAARLTVVRDFLLLFFFLQLGAMFNLSEVSGQAVEAAVLSVFVLIGKPLVVMVILGFMGYRRRTGFLTGLSCAQISEFSLILGALGVSLGHISEGTMGLITLVALVTITLSTYPILFSGPLYQRVGRFLRVFEREVPFRETDADSAAPERVDVVLVGLGRYGGSIAMHLQERGRSVLGVDFDPQVLRTMRALGVPVVYGDALDPEMLEHLPLHGARWLVNTTPGRESNLVLLKLARDHGFPGRIVLTAHNAAEEQAFAVAGADLVLRPFADAAEQAVDILTGAMENIRSTQEWPAVVREVRIRADSPLVGKRIAELALRQKTGVSILAVSRAGMTVFDPDPGFRLYPGDRIVLFGEEQGIARAVAYVGSRSVPEKEQVAQDDEFRLHAVEVEPDSPWVGKSLRELAFRQRFGATIVRIVRAGEDIISPGADKVLRPGDVVHVVASKRSFADLMRSDHPWYDSPRNDFGQH